MKNITRMLALQLIEPGSCATEDMIDIDPDELVEEREEDMHLIVETYTQRDHSKYIALNGAIYNLVNAHAEKAYERGIRAGAQLMMSLLTDPKESFKEAIAQLMKDGI